MPDRITTFELTWENCGCCSAADVVRETISIYRNLNLLIFCEYNGYRKRVGFNRTNIDKKLADDFFSFLEATEQEMNTDYAVEACDGSKWKIRMWHSSHKVTMIYGTIDYPPHGKEIEAHILSFIENATGVMNPQMFGCGQ